MPGSKEALVKTEDGVILMLSTLPSDPASFTESFESIFHCVWHLAKANAQKACFSTLNFFFRGLNAGDVFFPLLCSGPRHVGSGKLGLLAYSPELFLDESVFKPSVECGVKVVYCLLRGFQQSRIAKVWCYCLQKWVTPFPQDGN